MSSRIILKNKFSDGKKPSGADFADLISSMAHTDEVKSIDVVRVDNGTNIIVDGEPHIIPDGRPGETGAQGQKGDKGDKGTVMRPASAVAEDGTLTFSAEGEEDASVDFSAVRTVILNSDDEKSSEIKAGGSVTPRLASTVYVDDALEPIRELLSEESESENLADYGNLVNSVNSSGSWISNASVRSSNAIPIIPNVTYKSVGVAGYLKVFQGIWCNYFDEEGRFLGVEKFAYSDKVNQIALFEPKKEGASYFRLAIQGLNSSPGKGGLDNFSITYLVSQTIDGQKVSNLIDDTSASYSKVYSSKKIATELDMMSYVTENENLIDFEDLLPGYCTVNGQWKPNANGICTNKIMLDGVECLTISGIKGYSQYNDVFVSYFDSNGSFLEVKRVPLEVNTSTTQIATFEPSSDANYLRVTIQGANGASGLGVGGLTNIKVERGSVSTLYNSLRRIKDDSIDSVSANKVVGLAEVVHRIIGEEDVYSRSEEMRLLCIGNSFTCDNIYYVPALLEELAPSLDYTIGIAFTGSASLKSHANAIINEGSPMYYYECSKRSGKWQTIGGQDSQAYSEIFARHSWGLVTIQQASAYQAWETEFYPYADRIINYICKNVAGSKPRFGWLYPQVKEADKDATDTSFETICGVIQRLTSCEPIEFVLPCGAAIQNARQTTLQTLGAKGNLVYDTSGHLNEGLPCLIGAGAAALALLDYLHINHYGLMSSKLRITQEWIDAQGMHGMQRHGTPSENTEEDYLIAHKCSIAAVKNPFGITTIYIEPTAE